MSVAATPIQQVLRILLNVGFFIFGLLLINDAFQLLEGDKPWLPIMIIVIGMVMMTGNIGQTSWLGVLLFGVGVFLVLRKFGVITQPWLRNGLGGFLILFGTINLMRIIAGGALSASRSRPK